MKTQKIESAKFPLSGGYYTIERAGQELEHIGDKIIVECKIFLPTQNKDFYNCLKYNLQFQERVKVLERALYSTWGDYDNSTSYRVASFYTKASKWSEAFKEAQERAEQELQKLEDALTARTKVLEDAENN